MTPFFSYSVPPGSYVIVVTVDLENSSTFGGLVRCELVSQNNLRFGQARQSLAPVVAGEAGGASLTFYAAGFFGTGTVLIPRCAAYADGPTLPSVRAMARVLLIPTETVG
jgi:hypothetical protein